MRRDGKPYHYLLSPLGWGFGTGGFSYPPRFSWRTILRDGTGPNMMTREALWRNKTVF